MQSKDRIRVRHILNELGEACKYTEGISFDEFVEDGKTVRACYTLNISYRRSSLKNIH